MASIRHEIAERITRRAKKNMPLVVTVRDGKPSRVYHLEGYLKMKALPQKVKPWTRRRNAKPRDTAPIDPLGAVTGRLRSKLRRSDMYD